MLHSVQLQRSELRADQRQQRLHRFAVLLYDIQPALLVRQVVVRPVAECQAGQVGARGSDRDRQLPAVGIPPLSFRAGRGYELQAYTAASLQSRG